MPIKSYAVLFGLVLIAAGCKSSDNSASQNPGSSPATRSAPVSSPAASPASNLPAAVAVKSKIDSCKLLTSDELKQVQGEPWKEALRSDRDHEGLIVSQCYYSLPSAANSVVLNVTTAAEGAGARDPRALWKETFSPAEEEEREGDQDRDRKRDRDKKDSKPVSSRMEAEEKDSAPPQKVTGIGEDAYWLASPIGGALYVLQKDLFFRISVGGAGNANAKLNKSKTLARKALGRL